MVHSTQPLETQGITGYSRLLSPIRRDFRHHCSAFSSSYLQEHTMRLGPPSHTCLSTTQGSAEQCTYSGLYRSKVPYVLDMDARTEAFSTMLSQVQEGREKVIAFYSKTMAAPAQNHYLPRKELLAIVRFLQHFHLYLYGCHFLIRADHELPSGYASDETNPARWPASWRFWQSLNSLYEWDENTEQRKRVGRKHGNVDGLSLRSCFQYPQCDCIAKKDEVPM